MKPSLLILASLLIGAAAFLLAGCRKNAPDVGVNPETPTVGGAESADEILFVNEVEKTDVWILPDTEENRDLPYSTPTVNDLEENGEIRLSLSSLGGPGTYVVHMFSEDGMYYGAAGVPIEGGYTLRFRRQDWSWTLEVSDGLGNPVGSYEVFGAMWAGDGGDDLE
ncbi:MAG: hypothetical protein E7576_15190 [Ruminococcaceae bacterium]|jgi:hypothetical protein|nr:hypothetical protein [Oscillospiraceae bacterium]